MDAIGIAYSIHRKLDGTHLHDDCKDVCVPEIADAIRTAQREAWNEAVEEARGVLEIYARAGFSTAHELLEKWNKK